MFGAMIAVRQRCCRQRSRTMWVRVIDAFVDGLDVKGLGFGRSVPAMTGRPPYDPRDLLKLYLYGYLKRGALVAPAGA